MVTGSRTGSVQALPPGDPCPRAQAAKLPARPVARSSHPRVVFPGPRGAKLRTQALASGSSIPCIQAELAVQERDLRHGVVAVGVAKLGAGVHDRRIGVAEVPEANPRAAVPSAGEVDGAELDASSE